MIKIDYEWVFPQHISHSGHFRISLPLLCICRYGLYTVENETKNLVPQTGIVDIRMWSQHIINMITKQKQDVDTILVDFI